MQLLFIATFLAAVLISEMASTKPVDNLGLSIFLTAAICFTVLGFALFATNRVLAISDVRSRRNRIDRMKKFHAAIWIAASGAILLSLEWPTIVRQNLRLNETFLIDEVLILFPVLLPLLGSWAAFCDLHGQANPSLRQRVDFVVLHMRVYLAIVLIPLFIAFAAEDLARMFSFQALHSGACHAVIVVVMLLGMPWLLKTAWKTESLAAGDLRSRLSQLGDRAGFRCRDILLWNTNQQIVSAAVAGVLRPLRYVFLSDGLLRHLRSDEMEAIFLHEVGHVRRGHLWWRVLVLLPLILASFLVWRCAALELPNSIAVSLIAIVIGLEMVLLGWYSRLLEHDADLWAVAQLARELDEPKHFSTEFYVRVLDKLRFHSGHQPDRGTWFHPSVNRRVALLRAIDVDESREPRFRRFLSLVAGAILTSILASLGVLLFNA